MQKFETLKQYTQVVNGIRFFVDPNKSPFALVYFSENSSLLEDFEKLNIKFTDVRDIVVPLTRVPRTRINPIMFKAFRKLGLFPRSSTSLPPAEKNLIYDLSQYLITIDKIYQPTNYRQRVGLLIRHGISNAFIDYQDYQKVLIYSVDATKPIQIL